MCETAWRRRLRRQRASGRSCDSASVSTRWMTYLNPHDRCTRWLSRLQFAAHGITDGLVLRSNAAYWPIRRAGAHAVHNAMRCDRIARCVCAGRRAAGHRSPRPEPDAERQSAAARRRLHATAPALTCARSHGYTWTGVFSRPSTRHDAIATQLTLVSVRYESAAHVVRSPRHAPWLARRLHVSVVTLHDPLHVTWLAMLPRRVTSRQLGAATACRHLTHSWNSYMSPCPSLDVKPRACVQPRCYPSEAGPGPAAQRGNSDESGAARVSRIRTGPAVGNRRVGDA
jgi:hypothetical protein